MTWVEVQTSQLNKLSTFLFLYVFLFYIFVIVFHVDISMNIGHDDGTELLEEETLDKHTEPQVRSFNMLEGSSSSLWSIDLTW